METDEAIKELYKRLNSNIYKNVFPNEALNYELIAKIKQEIMQTVVTQNNHGLTKGKFVFMDSDGLFKISCADTSSTSAVDGIVSDVKDANNFVLQKSGKYPWYDLGWEETTIAYLSDTEPGGIKHYQNIKTSIYTPVGIFAGDCIIICPQQSSEGIAIREYDNESWTFESYTGDELNDTIHQVYDYYKGAS